MSANQTTNDDARSVAALEDQLEALANTAPTSFWIIAVRRLRRDRLTMVALGTLVVIALLSVFAQPISQNLLGVNSPDESSLLDTFLPPSSEHLLGTDALGRDQLTRLLYGGRISLVIAVLGTVATVVLGVSIGMAAAYFGKWVDDAVIYVINTLGAIPSLYLLLIVGALWDLTPLALALLFGFLGWPGIARLVRSTVYSLREQEYVMASKALGNSDISIMYRHILPNVIPIVIIATARRVGNLILAESALSFLSFGVKPPTSTWGTMLTKAQQFMLRPDGTHLVIAPGVMITITVLCLFVIGDGLRDAMDPRLR